MSRYFLVVATLTSYIVSLGGCVAASTLPGTSLGKYQVVGTLLTNTCGAGIGAMNPWDFSAELSQDSGTLYMDNTDGSDEVSGAFDSSAATSATLVSAVTQNVNTTAAVDGSTCNLTLATAFELKLSADSPPKSFTGTASYAYSVATAVSSNTDCTAQLASAGGKYSTLPCTVTYSFAATRQ